MAATEVERKWQEICMHDAYHLWTKQKWAYLSELSQQTANSTWYHADEVFALHILAVHAKYCTELICGGRHRAGFSSSRPLPSPDPLSSALAVSSHSHETESEFELETESATKAKSKTTVVNTETPDLALGLASGTTANEHHDDIALAVTVAIGIGVEDVISQDALSGVTENVPSEESQVTAEECSTGMKIKTEPEDASPLEDMGLTEDTYEPVMMGNERCQVTSDLPGVSCDQQTEMMTDMIYEVKCEDDGHFEDNADLRHGKPISTAQRINSMPSTAETEGNTPTTTIQAPSTSSDIAKKNHKCHVCHKILRRKGRPQRTFTNQEDSPMLCDVCQKDCDHTDGITNLLKRGTLAKKPKEDDEKHHGPTCMSTAHLLGGKSSGRTSYQCQRVCPSANRKGRNLHGHIHTREKTAEFKLYSKAYDQKSNLDSLTKIHTGEKMYKCTVCSQLFDWKEQLATHIKVHPVETPFKCDICLRAFCSSNILHRHMKKHIRHKPHRCSVCSKAFYRKDNMDVHMRIHTGEKPYKCSLCSKAYSQKSHLNAHMRIHTGEKPYKCKFCSKTFPQGRDLKLHIRTHTDERPHKYIC